MRPLSNGYRVSGWGRGSSSETFGHMPDLTQPTTTTPQDAGLRELTGRSRAILKQYFYEDAEAITFPLGHRTVSFTEPQVYHLLRVLTDETQRMSYTTMEQMVIGAVRGICQLHRRPGLIILKLDRGRRHPDRDSLVDPVTSSLKRVILDPVPALLGILIQAGKRKLHTSSMREIVLAKDLSGPQRADYACFRLWCQRGGENIPVQGDFRIFWSVQP